MNASLFDRARAERFAQLMDEASGARRHHAHSRLDEELAELVATGQRMQAMRLNGAPTESFKRDLRAQLVATAVREGIGVTAEADPELPRPRRFIGARPRTRGAIVIGVAAGTLALSGVSVASGEAIPGDALYGMKRSTERAQLALAGSDHGRGQLYLEFARTRVHEAYEVRANESGFVGSLQDMDADTQQGIRMLLTSAVLQHDTTALDAIERFVDQQRFLVAKLLDLSTPGGREKVTGSLKLLTDAQGRADAARAALACGASSTGSDALGPLVGVCGTSAVQTAPQSRMPAGQVVVPPAEGQPTTDAQPQSPAPAASPEASKKDEGGLLGELGRILGGLLG